MARVPTDFSPNVQNRPLTQNRISDSDANALAFGGGTASGLNNLGQGVEQGANDLYRAAQELRHRDATREARDAMTALSQKRRDLLYGTDTQPGYFHLKGQDAINAAPGVQEELTKFQKQMSASLKSDARDMFDPAATSEVQGELDRITNHSWDQRDAADLASWKSAASGAFDLAVANPFDQKNMDEQRRIVSTMALNAGLQAGNSMDEIKQAQKVADSNLLKGVMASIGVRGTADQAKMFYAKYKGELSGSDQLDAEAELDKLYRQERTDRTNARVEANAAREDAERKAGQALVHAYLNDQLDTKKIDASGASASMKLEMQGKLESDAASGGKVVHDDGTTFGVLWNGLVAKNTDPNKIWDSKPIMDAMIARKITGATADKMLKYLGERDSSPEHKIENTARENIMSAAKAQLVHENPLAGIQDPKGWEHYNNWFIAFNKAWDEKLKAGVPVSEFTNSQSKEYIGKDIGSYAREPGAIWADIAGGNEGPVADPSQVPAGTFTTAADVRQAYQDGKITKEAAKAIIKRDNLSTDNGSSQP